MVVLRALAFVLLCSRLLWAQAEWPKPNWEKVDTLVCRASDKPLSTTVGKYQIKLVPVPDPKTHELLCRSYLVDSNGHETLLLEDWNVSVHQGTGDDLFEDGNPALVLEGYSGGANCCYTYEIASLGDRPVILHPIRNEAPLFVFRDSVSRQFRIMTSDGAFDYFDGLCHACAPFPRVVLRADVAGLHDVSAQFVEQYDSEIALARAKIAREDIARFQVTDFKDAKGVVLEIVFSYLYSGRETQAWQTLEEMWPADDQARVRRLITQTRAKGLLSKLSSTAPRTSTVTSGADKHL
jgi:hypothetical protein